MNNVSKKNTLFYPIFHFSTNRRQAVDDTEKETFGRFRKGILKLETINARNLSKSFQPIHSFIIIHIILHQFKSLKIKK